MTKFGKYVLHLSAKPNENVGLFVLIYFLFVFLLLYVFVSNGFILFHRVTPDNNFPTRSEKIKAKLFCFFMGSVLFAEFAVFLHFKSFCVVLLVLKRIVISLFAFCTSESYFCSCAFSSHNTPSESQKINTPNPKCYVIVSNLCRRVKIF